MPTSTDDAFKDLLLNPPGTYGLTPFGNTTAVVLRGDPLFIERAFNLFASMGSERGQPVPPLHQGTHLNTAFFCLPQARIEAALRLYLYARLVRANTTDILDEEGDFTEVACAEEAALWEEAGQLAIDFIVSHMRPDYRALPVYEPLSQLVINEHGLGDLGAAHTSEDA